MNAEESARRMAAFNKNRCILKGSFKVAEQMIMDEYKREAKRAAEPDKAWSDLWVRRVEVTRAAAYHAMRCLTDPSYRTAGALRRRLRKFMIRGHRIQPITQLIGCDRPTFITWIESHWQRGMGWHNYGVGDGKWNLDHTIACDHFDLTDEQQQRECFHYTNIKPMWALENYAKGNKLPAQHQPELVMPC